MNRETQSDRQPDRDRARERERESERQRQRDREKDRERHRQSDRDRALEREREGGGGGAERETKRESPREREGGGRERERESIGIYPSSTQAIFSPYESAVVCLLFKLLAPWLWAAINDIKRDYFIQSERERQTDRQTDTKRLSNQTLATTSTPQQRFTHCAPTLRYLSCLQT